MGMMDFFTGSGGTSGEHGIDVAYIDDYADYAGIRKNLTDYYSGIMAGEEPEFFQTYLPEIEQQQEQSIKKYYLGEGNRRSNSAMGLAAQTGAATGVGPKATVAAQQGVASQMTDKLTAAKAAMTKYRADWMGNNQLEAANQMRQLPQGQRYSASQYNIQPTSGDSGMLGNMGFGDIMSMGSQIGGMFGSGENTSSYSGGFTGGNNTAPWSGNSANISGNGTSSDAGSFGYDYGDVSKVTF